MNVRLYIWQRLTAAIMVPLILVHLTVIFYAAHKDLSGADILARTRGSVAWALFYSAFVVAAAVHASIGLRNIISEWSPLSPRATVAATTTFGLVLIVLGLRAVAAVVLS